MNKTICLLIPLCFLFVGCYQNDNAKDRILTIGTFNLMWLGDGKDDMIVRDDTDYLSIATILMLGSADIIAVQEIENEIALEKIVSKMPNYNFTLSSEISKQRLGFIYKNSVNLIKNSDYLPLKINTKDKGRPGYICEFSIDDFNIIIHNVHLKSTSRYDSTDALKIESRHIRTHQSEQISKWIDSINLVSPSKNIMIIGDFNDNPIRKNSRTLLSLCNNENLNFLTLKERSRNFYYAPVIDHIVVNSALFQNFIIRSVFQLDLLRAFSNRDLSKISDHIPIFTQFSY